MSDLAANVAEAFREAVQYSIVRTLRPRAEWHEEHGSVLWWKLPITEAPYCGTELDDDFPEYATHWSPLPRQEDLIASDGAVLF